MMIRRHLLQCLALLSTTFLTAPFAGECHESAPKEDPAALTMREMRIVSAILEDQRRMLGTYPAADGEFHRLLDVLEPDAAGRGGLRVKDVWGHPVWYRANDHTHQLISYGSDGIPDQDYARQGLYVARHLTVVESHPPRGDLVLMGGRFIRRPFVGRGREMATINSINAIFIAAASYAVDYNHYPGSAASFSPVTELIPELVPVYIAELPTLDGWGRPLLYANVRGSLWLIGLGEDGQPDHEYYPDLTCGLGYFGSYPPVEKGGDVVQGCGAFTIWPQGTEHESSGAVRQHRLLAVVGHR